jgi:S-adenosylmethionine-diacylgycerolhomoserine-N-methlytransferase
LLIVDFGDQARLPRWFKRALRAWLAQFSVTPRDELGAELERIAAMPGYTVRHMPLFRGYAVYAVVTRA